MTKICDSCKHCLPQYKCGHQKFVSIDLVTGKINRPYCRRMRDMEAYCGTEGKRFEPASGQLG